MLRSTFDKLLSWAGIVVAILMLIVSGLAFWGASFADSNVKSQLEMQSITMPSGPALDAIPAEDKAALLPYAGQKMTNGDQAAAYADHYIKAHMDKASQGKSYAQISSACANTDPLDSPQCRLKYNTMFTGNALRGMLLTAYAFGTIGKIAKVAGIVCAIGGVIMLVLSFVGLNHAKKAGKEIVGEKATA